VPPALCALAYSFVAGRQFRDGLSLTATEFRLLGRFTVAVTALGEQFLLGVRLLPVVDLLCRC